MRRLRPDMKCNNCGEHEAKHRSLGGGNLCHKCAHDLGLTHKHPPDILDTLHFHEMRGASPEEIAVHLKKYLDTEAEA